MKKARMKETTKILWDTYKSHTQKTMTDAWNSKRHTDLTILAGNGVIKCHKMVISSGILYFKKLLEQDFIEDAPVMIDLRAPYDLIHALLTFTYLGEVTIDSERVNPLLEIADELGVIGLMRPNPVKDKPDTIHMTDQAREQNAVEALQSLSNVVERAPPSQQNQSVPINYQTAPRQPSTPMTFQPSTGEQPPLQDQEDYQSLRYKAAACRKSPMYQQNDSPALVIKGEQTQTITAFTDSMSPNDYRNSPPSTSGTYYPVTTKHELPDSDSEDSDCELHIDEGPDDDQSPMRYCEEQMYVEESEPQDLRVESRQQPSSIYGQVVAPPGAIQQLIPQRKIPSPSTPSIIYPVPITAASFMRDQSKIFTISELNENSTQIAMNNPLTGNFSGSQNNVFTMVSPIEERSQSISPKTGKKSPRPGSSSSKSKPRTYSMADLKMAVDLVINRQTTPNIAVNKYDIPRRTFFRHLRRRRTELGLTTKVPSKPSSTSNSPIPPLKKRFSKSKSPPSMVSTVHNNPVSGTNLHRVLQSISVINQIKRENTDDSSADEHPCSSNEAGSSHLNHQ